MAIVAIVAIVAITYQFRSYLEHRLARRSPEQATAPLGSCRRLPDPDSYNAN